MIGGLLQLTLEGEITESTQIQRLEMLILQRQGDIFCYGRQSY